MSVTQVNYHKWQRSSSYGLLVCTIEQKSLFYFQNFTRWNMFDSIEYRTSDVYYYNIKNLPHPILPV